VYTIVYKCRRCEIEGDLQQEVQVLKILLENKLHKEKDNTCVGFIDTKGVPLCRFYPKDTCRYGVKCKFMHIK
jgi:hypothetical protein